MITIIAMILIISSCFLAAVLNLALESRVRSLTMRIAAIGAVVIGTALYGYGYSVAQGFSAVSILRALLAVCRMFGGVNDLPSVEAAPLFASPVIISLFWFGHFLAFYLTASAAIATLGARMLRNIRLRLLQRGPLSVVFGVNDEALAYGRFRSAKTHRPVLFVCAEATLDQENKIKSTGAVLETSPDALSPDISFLRRVGMLRGRSGRFFPFLKRKRRTLELAALQDDPQANLEYATRLSGALEKAGIAPSQTSLLIRGAAEKAEALQAKGNAGFGTVLAFDDAELTARLLIRENPPCNTIAFDENGKAAEDYHAVIVGFGRMGQAVLMQLVKNGQFHGSHFRVDVFDPSPQNGFLHGSPILARYDICFHKTGAKSDEFYQFLEERGDAVKTIVLCAGNPLENREIENDLAGWYENREKMPALLKAARSSSLYESGILDIGRVDAMAREINQVYCSGNGKNALENWESCDYFSRQSCRASADFFPAILKASGRTEDEVLNGAWPPSGEMMKNLGITEHLRWCAFHYVSGYRTMPPEVYEERAEIYRNELAGLGHSSLQVRKDSAKKLHACLIPWEELDALSARESSITGKHVDFKAADCNNILVMDKVLAACRRK